MLIDFNAKWFQAYCRAVLEDDREMAQIYIEDALGVIAEARRGQPGDVQREAMDAATRYLTRIKELELRQSA